jgi:hypothetical protein
MARSAKIAELNLDTTRISEQPSVTMPGTVDKIIPSPGPSQPEKAQIAVEGADRLHRDLRIENMLTDEHGDSFTQLGIEIQTMPYHFAQLRTMQLFSVAHVRIGNVRNQQPLTPGSMSVSVGAIPWP